MTWRRKGQASSAEVPAEIRHACQPLLRSSFGIEWQWSGAEGGRDARGIEALRAAASFLDGTGGGTSEAIGRRLDEQRHAFSKLGQVSGSRRAQWRTHGESLARFHGWRPSPVRGRAPLRCLSAWRAGAFYERCPRATVRSCANSYPGSLRVNLKIAGSPGVGQPWLLKWVQILLITRTGVLQKKTSGDVICLDYSRKFAPNLRNSCDLPRH